MMMRAYHWVFAVLLIFLPNICFGDDSYDLRQLNARVQQLHDQGFWKASLPIAERALEFTSQRYGTTHQFTEKAHERVARTYAALHRYDHAFKHYQRVLQIGAKLRGPEDISVARMLENLVYVRWKQQHFRDAAQLTKQALKIYEKIGATTRMESSYRKLELLYRILGKPNEVDEALANALLLKEARYGSNHPALAVDLCILGRRYLRRGHSSAGKELLRRFININKKLHITEEKANAGCEQLMKYYGNYIAVIKRGGTDMISSPYGSLRSKQKIPE